MGFECCAEFKAGGAGMMHNQTAAIILAAGSGRRMNSEISKQYLELAGRPLIYYALKAFEDSLVEKLVLVVQPGDEEYCRINIVEKYHLKKVCSIVAGGRERYHSVYEGLKQLEGTSYVFIHDGARPFVTDSIINRCWENVQKYQACVVGMPVKDTIKIADESGFTKYTPDRKLVWTTQTPQVFSYDLIKKAYDKLAESDISNITDDTMVLERMLNQSSKWVEGSYYNIKITTPEDLAVAQVFLKQYKL